jgi:tetratricopeptide (TPR) repeat protein
MNIVDSKKQIDDMIEMVDKVIFSDSKKALRIALETLELSKEANYPQAEAILLLKIGNIYSNISEYSKAIEYIITAIPMLELYNLDYYFCYTIIMGIIKDSTFENIGIVLEHRAYKIIEFHTLNSDTF